MSSTAGTGKLAGRSALVTGGASGMGRAIAVTLAAEGASVVVADVDEAGGEQTAGLVTAAGGTAVFQRTDVSSAEDCRAAVDVAVSRHGGLHLAVNAAAIEIEEGTRLHECPDDVFDRLVAVNLRGLFLSMKYEIGAMLDSGPGASLVNIASVNSFRARPGQTGYTATKHGVIGITRTAALEYAPLGIRVNAICPGGIDTPMLRNTMARRGLDPDDTASRLSLTGRFGTVDEIARAALWLCSDDSSYTIGHALSVDAGYLIN